MGLFGNGDSSKDSKDSGHAGWFDTAIVGIGLGISSATGAADPGAVQTQVDNSGHHSEVVQESNVNTALHDSTISHNDTGTNQSK